MNASQIINNYRKTGDIYRALLSMLEEPGPADEVLYDMLVEDLGHLFPESDREWVSRMTRDCSNPHLLRTIYGIYLAKTKATQYTFSDEKEPIFHQDPFVYFRFILPHWENAFNLTLHERLKDSTRNPYTIRLSGSSCYPSELKLAPLINTGWGEHRWTNHERLVFPGKEAYLPNPILSRIIGLDIDMKGRVKLWNRKDDEGFLSAWIE
jgi:hypothetical protein